MWTEYKFNWERKGHTTSKLYIWLNYNVFFFLVRFFFFLLFSSSIVCTRKFSNMILTVAQYVGNWIQSIGLCCDQAYNCVPHKNQHIYFDCSNTQRFCCSRVKMNRSHDAVQMLHGCPTANSFFFQIFFLVK